MAKQNEIWNAIHGKDEYGMNHESEFSLVIRAENWGDEDGAAPVFVISVAEGDEKGPACVIDAIDGCTEAPGWINDGGYPLKGDKPVWAAAAEKMARLLHEPA